MSKKILLVYDDGRNYGDSFTYSMGGGYWNKDDLILSSSNSSVATVVVGGCGGSNGNVFIRATGVGNCVISISVRDMFTNQLYTVEDVVVTVVPVEYVHATIITLKSNSIVLFKNVFNGFDGKDYIPYTLNHPMPSNYCLIFATQYNSNYYSYLQENGFTITSDRGDYDGNHIAVTNNSDRIRSAVFKYGIGHTTWDTCAADDILNMGNFSVSVTNY